MVVRAGMGTGTTLRHQGSSQYVIPTGQLIVKYKGPAENAEVIYLTFPKPVTAQYVILQFCNINNNIQLAELRIIKCRSCNGIDFNEIFVL